ncbi:MAG: hypothetical protein RLO06_15045 [Parvibaculum sp.]|jgi:hypothetical protein
MQRDVSDSVPRTKFLQDLDEAPEPTGGLDVSTFHPTKGEVRPSQLELESVARETGFTAGMRTKPEQATAQFAVRLYPSTARQIDDVCERMGWSKRIFLERALKALIKTLPDYNP